jgi:hypothetical protein
MNHDATTHQHDDVAVGSVHEPPDDQRRAEFAVPAGVPTTDEAVRLVGRAFGELAPLPRLWPLGKAARARRSERAEIRERTRAARRDLSRAWNAAAPPGVDFTRAWRPVGPRRNVVVIAGLALVVFAIVVVGAWMSSHAAPALPTPAASAGTTVQSSAPSTTGSSSPTSATRVSALPPIPSSGVAPIIPPTGTGVDPRTVAVVDPPAGPPTNTELASPEVAAAAWLARWCPFAWTEEFGAAEARARAAMTANGWGTFDPAGNTAARASWAKTVAAHETGRCSAATAVVNADAPRTDTAAVVIVSATRVVTGSDESPYTEQVTAQRVVLRGTDGAWHVDLPSAGG